MLITPFGNPVEPEVSNILPIVSKLISETAPWIPSRGFVDSISLNDTVGHELLGKILVASVLRSQSSASIAALYGSGSSTKITDGSLWEITLFSF